MKLMLLLLLPSCLVTTTDGTGGSSDDLFGALQEHRMVCRVTSTCTEDAWTTHGCTTQVPDDVGPGLRDQCEERVGCACEVACVTGAVCGVDL